MFQPFSILMRINLFVFVFVMFKIMIRLTVCFPVSACCALEVDNQSAVAAIAGIAPQVVPISSNLSQMLQPGPNLYQVVSSMSSYTSPCPSPSGSVVPRTVIATSLGPLEATSIGSSLVSLTSTSVPSATPTPASSATSQPGATAVTSCFPQPIVVPTHSGTSGFQLDSISRLPDPPIILLNEQVSCIFK